jgi:hypothetical protein
MLGSGLLMPIHWGTFNLAVHPWDEPAEQLVGAAGSAPLVMPRIGSAIEPAHGPRIDPWWREIGSVPAAAAPELPEPVGDDWLPD